MTEAPVTETLEAAPEQEVVEPVAEQAAVESEQEQEEGDPDSEKPQDEKRLRDEKGKFKGVQSRIDELTRARREAERSAEYWKGLATQGTAQSSAEAAPKPTADQFDDYDAFIEALTDWKVEEKTRDLGTKAAKSAETSFKLATWEDRQTAARASLPDYDTVVGQSDAPVAQHVQEALLDSERGPELAYQLASNPELLVALNGMNPIRAAIEIGRLEAAVAAPVVKPVSKAPAPITPLSPGANARVDLSNADMDTFIAERRKQGAKY